MIYLTLTDINVMITDYSYFDILELTGTTTGNTISDYAERVAIDTVFSYIQGIYDRDVELSKTEYDRDFMIVNSVSSIMMYLLYQRVSTNMIPEHINEQYDKVIENLQSIQSRKIIPKIEKRDDEYYVPRISSSSSTTRINYNY